MSLPPRRVCDLTGLNKGGIVDNPTLLDGAIRRGEFLRNWFLKTPISRMTRLILGNESIFLTCISISRTMISTVV